MCLSHVLADTVLLQSETRAAEGGAVQVSRLYLNRLSLYTYCHHQGLPKQFKHAYVPRAECWKMEV